MSCFSSFLCVRPETIPTLSKATRGKTHVLFYSWDHNRRGPPNHRQPRTSTETKVSSISTIVELRRAVPPLSPRSVVAFKHEGGDAGGCNKRAALGSAIPALPRRRVTSLNVPSKGLEEEGDKICAFRTIKLTART